MAQRSANAELVIRIIGLVNQGRIEEALEEAGEGFEIDWTNSIGPLKGVYSGRRQTEELWSTFSDAWDELRWEIEELIEVDDSRVILVNNVRTRGRGSGVEVNATGVQLWTLAGGRAERMTLYQTKAEALEAVGMAG